MGTHTYDAGEVIANCLAPLCQNVYKLDDLQSFPSMMKEQAPLSLDEKYVSYDSKFLFTNIPVDGTIFYVINEIYQKN